MIAPSFWVDPKSGNNYMLTVQYPRQHNLKLSLTSSRFLYVPREQQIPRRWSPLASIKQINTPTEVDHYVNCGGASMFM